jgi:predicted permease
VLERLKRASKRELGQQVDEELAAHLELLVEEYLAEGMSPSAARAAARERFGDFERFRAEGVRIRCATARRRRSALWVDDLLSDVRFAVRGLRRKPGFALVSILTLAVGIGASAAVFAVGDAVLVRPLPFEDPERVVQLNEDYPFDDIRWHVSAANYLDWRTRARSFSDIAAISQVLQGETNLTGVEEPLRVPIARVTPSFFDVLGVAPALGRPLLPDDDAPDATPVVVVSHALWSEALGSDPAVVGRTVRVNDAPHTVVGVMPRDFGFGVAGGPRFLWLPRALPPERQSDRRQRMYRVVARLRDGVTLDQARTEIRGIAAALADEYPEANQWEGRPWGADVATARERLVEVTIRPSLVVLSGAVGIVLLIAWVNVTNLLVARASARRREIAVRSAIGAGRGRMARQLLTEALVLSVLGGAAGLLLARWLVTIFTAVVVGDLPVISETSLLGWTLAVTGATSLVTALACGSVPAWRAIRESVGEGLKEGSGHEARRGRMGSGLVAVELSLAMVLVVGMGLMIQTMTRISRIPLGFDADGLQVVSMSLDRGSYARQVDGGRWELGSERSLLVDRTLESIRGLAGVESAAATVSLPLQFAQSMVRIHFPGLEREPLSNNWRPVDGMEIHGFPNSASVTADFFRTMGIRIVSGRGFTAADEREGPLTVVVNEAFGDEFGLEDPVGRTIRLLDGSSWRSAEIVGVVNNVLRMYPRYPIASQYTGVGSYVYLPYGRPAERYSARGLPLSLHFVVRHTGPADALGEALPQIVRQADTQSPITLVASMKDLAAENLADRRAHLNLVGSLALVSLFLALVGVYGVVSFQVGQRVREIGVRMTLGAGANRVVSMILADGARIATLGVLLGVAGAMAVTRVLTNWLYEVSPTHPPVFVATSLLLVSVATGRASLSIG